MKKKNLRNVGLPRMVMHSVTKNPFQYLIIARFFSFSPCFFYVSDYFLCFLSLKICFIVSFSVCFFIISLCSFLFLLVSEQKKIVSAYCPFLYSFNMFFLFLITYCPTFSFLSLKIHSNLVLSF